MAFIVAVLLAASIQPRDADAPAASDGLPPSPTVVEEQVPPDSAAAPADSLPSVAAPARPEQPQPQGPPGSDILYLEDGSVLVGRVLGIGGTNITMFVAWKEPRQPGYVVQFDTRLVRTLSRIAPSDSTRSPVRTWQTGVGTPRFGWFTEGTRVPFYPQICPEIGIAYVRVDLGEIEKGIQHLYDTNATLRPYRLTVESFEEQTIGFAVGIAFRMSPCAAAGLTGVYPRSGSVEGLAIGELRVRPRAAYWPWLSLGIAWRRVRVRDSQNVQVQSGAPKVWYEGATWRSSSSSPTLGIRFDTGSHTEGA